MKETRFKYTEVGRIPDDWNVMVVGECCNVYTGGECPNEWSKGKDHYFKYPIYSNGKECYGYTFDFRINKDAACISSIGENTGDVFFYKANFTPIIRLKVIVPKHNGIDTKCLYYFLKYNRIDSSKNGGIPNINSDDVKKIKLPLPPIEEQRRIASALTSIDNLIDSLDRLIAKKRDIKQGAMQQLLSGKKRLKGFTEPWVEKKLGADALILRGGSPRPIEDYITDNTDGLNWIKIGDVKPNDKYIRKTAEKIIKEGLVKTRQVKKGDFILSNSMSFGRPYILDIDGCIHDGWLVIQDYQEAYDMQFLYYILCSDAIMNQYVSMAAGSGVQNLNKDKVADVLLYAPTSIKEQSAIASVLTSLDNELSALETKRKKYEQIKQGMMQQLLTGKIRLQPTAIVE